MYQKSAMTFSSLTSAKDLEFGDAHIDVASSGLTYINIKLFKKKGDQDDYRLQQSGSHCQGVSGNDSECRKH